MINNKYYVTSGVFFTLGICAFKILDTLPEFLPNQTQFYYKLLPYNYIFKWCSFVLFAVALTFLIKGNKKNPLITSTLNQKEIENIISTLESYNNLTLIRDTIEDNQTCEGFIPQFDDLVILYTLKRKITKNLEQINATKNPTIIQLLKQYEEALNQAIKTRNQLNSDLSKTNCKIPLKKSFSYPNISRLNAGDNKVI
ncbi:MAG: hypothetical protein HRK26_04110 [Rickettsiaceae bacterium H1]|nr:hypothetical protein [Rickettsiaceae bacterium H1]